MKVELNDIRLGISAMGELCMIGNPDKKNPNLWKHKKEIHNDFLHSIITCWKGKKQIIKGDTETYELSVVVVKKKKKKPILRKGWTDHSIKK